MQMVFVVCSEHTLIKDGVKPVARAKEKIVSIHLSVDSSMLLTLCKSEVLVFKTLDLDARSASVAPVWEHKYDKTIITGAWEPVNTSGRIAVLTESGGLVVFDICADPSKSAVYEFDQDVQCFCWHPCGTLLAIGSKDSIHIVDVGSKREVEVVTVTGEGTIVDDDDQCSLIMDGMIWPEETTIATTLKLIEGTGNFIHASIRFYMVCLSDG